MNNVKFKIVEDINDEDLILIIGDKITITQIIEIIVLTVLPVFELGVIFSNSAKTIITPEIA
mgnify:CR=1 FL=1